MPFKFNNGRLAYTCFGCSKIMGEGWEAVALREQEREEGRMVLCPGCTSKEMDEEQSDVLEKLDD